MQRISEELRKATEEMDFLKNQLDRLANKDFGHIIGKSKIIKEKIDIAMLSAKSNAPILILGESGTGKEVFARAIHNYSGVKGSFVPVNCSAIPKELFESEFFGYKPGAFTGASKKGKAGYFELAHNGTLFLDEIADLPIDMQAKLLRVLQDNKVKRLGAEKFIDVNVRIISATNKDVGELVKKKEFREDLYYRLNVIKIELPPLRKRREDIVLFIDHFLRKISREYNKAVPRIDKDVIEILTSHNWDGNIRELNNVLEQMVVLCREDIISKDLIPEYILDKSRKDNFLGSGQERETGLRDLIEKYEKHLIIKALKDVNGNILKAAKILKIPRSTLHYKIENHQIDVNKLTGVSKN